MWDPPGCSGITFKKTPEVIPFLWASSTLRVSGFSSFILMQNWLQVPCSPFKAKFLKTFSQLDSIKYFRMQPAWGSVRRRASVCWNQMQLDVLSLEMWWGNSRRRSIRKDCPERRDDGLRFYFKQPVMAGVIALHENEKHPVGAALWSGCVSAAPACEELQEGTSLWVLQEPCFIWFTP